MIDRLVLNANYTTIRPLVLYKIIAKTLANTEGTIKKWTLQRNWQHRSHKTKKNKTKVQQNMYVRQLHATKHGWYEHDKILRHLA